MRDYSGGELKVVRSAYLQLSSAEASFDCIDKSDIWDSQTHEWRFENLHPELVTVVSEPDNSIMGIPVPSLHVL